VTKGYDLIHVHEGRAIYWALIQSLLFKVPYVVTRRIDNPLKNKWLSKKAYEKAGALVGLSNEIVLQIKKKHPTKLIYKIPSSPVSYDHQLAEVATIRQKFENKFIVIQASNLLKHKGHITTLDAALLLLKKKKNNIQIVILGDGPERESLEKIKKDNSLTNVSFMGKQLSMGNWFKAADLFIHPSYSEGLGSVILEAINENLPVVGSNAGGIPDIIDHNESGLLVEKEDAEQLANAIISIASDAILKSNLMEGGRKKLAEFSIQKTSQSYKGVYQRLVSSPHTQKIS